MSRKFRSSRLLSPVAAALLAGGVAASSGVAQAQSQELKWTHFGIRPLAMGNAFVAVADDYNALFYNPAGLARLKTWDGELLNPAVEVSANTVAALEDVSKLASGSGGDTDAVLDFLEKNTGKTHHFSLGLTPHLVFPGFGFALGLDVSSTMAVHRQISTNVQFGPRLIAPFAFAMNFLEDRLSVGAGIKIVAQGGVDREFSINDIEAFSSKKNKEGTDGTGAAAEDTGPKLDDYVEGGFGVGGDFGLLFTPIKTMQPTLGLSVTDVGGTPFTKMDVGGDALGTPRARLPSVNTGFSMIPWQTGGMFLRTSVDAHAINQPVHYSKKLNFGTEWGFGDIIKVEAGLHQGELSGGFEFDVFLFTMRFGTYAEQLGTIAGQDDNLRDRRYALQLKLLI
jgi:hypothetical protein